MAELNYTKGEWVFVQNKEGQIVWAKQQLGLQKMVAIVTADNNDAQLIASAPDLYEACKEAERTIDSALAKGTFLPNLNRAVRKALAKAEGK